MNKKQFEKVILNIQLAQKRSREINKLGLNLMDIEGTYQTVIDELFRAAFNEEQVGWIDWFLYEKEGIRGEINKAYKTVGKKKVEICHTIDSLWETVCEAGQQKDFDNRLGG
jgi:hypothetical protein